MKVLDKLKYKISAQNGITVIEIVLVIIVLIGLVILFQNNIRGIVTSIFARIQSNIGQIQ